MNALEACKSDGILFGLEKIKPNAYIILIVNYGTKTVFM